MRKQWLREGTLCNITWSVSYWIGIWTFVWWPRDCARQISNYRACHRPRVTAALWNLSSRLHGGCASCEHLSVQWQSVAGTWRQIYFWLTHNISGGKFWLEDSLTAFLRVHDRLGWFIWTVLPSCLHLRSDWHLGLTGLSAFPIFLPIYLTQVILPIKFLHLVSASWKTWINTVYWTPKSFLLGTEPSLRYIIFLL